MVDCQAARLQTARSAANAAVRECDEELKFNPGYAGKLLCRRVKDGVDYTTFINDVENEFSPPKLNREHDAWQWIIQTEALSSHEANK